MLTESIIAEIFSQGLGYGAFALLLIYTLRKQDQRDKKAETRERNYQRLLKDALDKLDIVNDIKESVDELKEVVTFNHKNTGN